MQSVLSRDVSNIQEINKKQNTNKKKWNIHRVPISFHLKKLTLIPGSEIKKEEGENFVDDGLASRQLVLRQSLIRAGRANSAMPDRQEDIGVEEAFYSMAIMPEPEYQWDLLERLPYGFL